MKKLLVIAKKMLETMLKVMMAVMPIVISKSSDYIYKKFYADKYTPEYTDDDDDYPEIVRTCELEKEDEDGEF